MGGTHGGKLRANDDRSLKIRFINSRKMSFSRRKSITKKVENDIECEKIILVVQCTSTCMYFDWKIFSIRSPASVYTTIYKLEGISVILLLSRSSTARGFILVRAFCHINKISSLEGKILCSCFTIRFFVGVK